MLERQPQSGQYRKVFKRMETDGELMVRLLDKYPAMYISSDRLVTYQRESLYSQPLDVAADRLKLQRKIVEDCTC